MNKIFKVKRNSSGQSVVTSEIAKSHTAGKVTAIVAGIALALVSGGASAATLGDGIYPVKFGSFELGRNDNNNILLDSESFKAHINGAAVILGENSIVHISTINAGNSLSEYFTNATAINGDIGRVDNTNLNWHMMSYEAVPEAVLDKSKSINEQHDNQDQSFVSIGGSNINSRLGGIAIGDNSEANGGIAVGSSSYAHYLTSVAIGRGAVGGHFGIAIGEGAVSTVNTHHENASPQDRSSSGGVAIGSEAKTNSMGVALGSGASSEVGYSAVAIGNTDAHGNRSVSIGSGKLLEHGAFGVDSISIKGFASKDNSISVGYDSRATALDSISIGRNAENIVEKGVALGSDSFANVSAGASGYLSNGESDPTWVSTEGAVSIGYRGYILNGVTIHAPRTRQITSLAAGTEDTDAVNVAQLKVVKALADTKVDKDYVDSALKDLIDSTLIVIDDISSAVNDISSTVEKGFNVTTSDGTTTNHQLGETIAVDGGKNIVTTTDDKGTVHVAMKDDIEVKSVSVEGSTIAITQDGINAGDKKVNHVADGAVAIDSKDAVNGSQLFAVKDTADKAHQTAQLAEVKASDAQSIAKTAQTEAKVAKSTSDKAIAAVEKLNDTAVKYDDSSKDKVTLSGSQGTTIANVKDGIEPTDAVNVRQLNQQGNIINQRIDNLADNVKKNKKRNDAGIASTAAMANIPQVMLAGKSGVGVGVGHRSGQNAIAVGYSRASDNAKHIIKLSAGLDTQSKATFGAGYMYQW